MLFMSRALSSWRQQQLCCHVWQVMSCPTCSLTTRGRRNNKHGATENEQASATCRDWHRCWSGRRRWRRGTAPATACRGSCPEPRAPRPAGRCWRAPWRRQSLRRCLQRHPPPAQPRPVAAACCALPDAPDCRLRCTCARVQRADLAACPHEIVLCKPSISIGAAERIDTAFTAFSDAPSYLSEVIGEGLVCLQLEACCCQ